MGWILLEELGLFENPIFGMIQQLHGRLALGTYIPKGGRATGVTGDFDDFPVLNVDQNTTDAVTHPAGGL